MDRAELIAQIERYEASDEERSFKGDMIDLMRNQERCFYRDDFQPGHITGSGILLDKSGTRILMNHHKGLNKWLCFGGHADGDENILNVATREVIEESGIENIRAVSENIFDLDIHPIPTNTKKNEPYHFHYDIRYLFSTDHDDFKISDESVELKWCSFDEALKLDTSKSMKRMINKLQAG